MTFLQCANLRKFLLLPIFTSNRGGGEHTYFSEERYFTESILNYF